MAAKRYIPKIPWDLIEDLSPERHTFCKVEAFVYLANHARYTDDEETVHGVKCKKGQFVTSSRELALAFGWPETNVRRYLQLLVKKEHIIYHTIVNGTVITMLSLADKTTIEEAKQECGAQCGAPNGAVGGAASGALNPTVLQILTELGGAQSGAQSGAVSGGEAAHIARVHLLAIIDIIDIICICQKYPPEMLFEAWWELYDNKKGRKTARSKWLKLSPEIWAKAIWHTAAYVKATPDKNYRKHPETYLNGECWNDEITERTVSSDTEQLKKEATLQERHSNFVKWLSDKFDESEKYRVMPIFHVTLDNFIEMLNACGGDAKKMADTVGLLLRSPITPQDGLIGVFRKHMKGEK